jgi:hypothetical protein
MHCQHLPEAFPCIAWPLTLAVDPFELAVSSLNHCGLTDSHPSHRRLTAALLLRWPTIPGYYPLDPGCFTRNLRDVPMLAWLLRFIDLEKQKGWQKL